MEHIIDLESTIWYLGVPINQKSKCLDITNMMLTVLSTHMPNYISSTFIYRFVVFGGLLHLILLHFTMFVKKIPQMISYKIIGAIPRYGDFSATSMLNWEYLVLDVF